MFGGNKKVKVSFADEVLEDMKISTTRPFLPRKQSITDLNSLYERISDLKNQIRNSKENIENYEYKIEKLERGIRFMNIDTSINSSCTANYSDYPEVIDKFKEDLITNIKGKIETENELIHTCEDELEWLEKRVGMGPSYGKSMFKYEAFDFNPNKDHC